MLYILFSNTMNKHIWLDWVNKLRKMQKDKNLNYVKMFVLLRGTIQVWADWQGTDPLSIHWREREVVAALWNQPHAVPSTLGAEWAKPSIGQRGPLFTWIGRAPHKTQKAQPAKSKQRSNTLMPHLVTSSRYWDRRL